jgi:flavin reductase (DIM6/NTAB) family NADH-FMN oxidoreductase RutF
MERHAVPEPVTTAQFRATLGLFATGVTVVGARAGNLVHGMTANAFTSVSLDPLLVLVCVEHEAVMRQVIDEAGAFGVSVLGADQERLARWFSTSSRPQGLAQFSGIGWSPGELTGAPLLDDALAWLECEVSERHVGGDHDIYLARVVSAVHRAPGSGPGPLVWYGGGYRQLDGTPYGSRSQGSPTRTASTIRNSASGENGLVK